MSNINNDGFGNWNQTVYINKTIAMMWLVDKIRSRGLQNVTKCEAWYQLVSYLTGLENRTICMVSQLSSIKTCFRHPSKSANEQTMANFYVA